MGRGFDYDILRQINPTLIIALILSFFHVSLLGSAFVFYKLPWFAFIIPCAIQTFIVFMCFTVIHDGTHEIASQRKWLNELMMLACWPIFVANPWMFRRIHLTHHTRTNQGALDPDHFTAHRYLAMRVFKSFFLIFYYHYYAFRHFKTLRLRAHTLLSLLMPVFLINLAIVTPFTWPILFVWLMPVFFGVGILAYLNTAFPHHPARETNRFRNTHNAYVPWVAQLLMLNQNLHLVHHLNPKLPWYEYPAYWHRHQAEIRSQGARTLQLTKRQEPYALVPSWVHDKLDQLVEKITPYLP